MNERNVEIATEDGTLPAFAAHPEGEGAWPAVILYMDAPGVREELRNFTRRIAGEGYFCLLPDLYYRLGTLRFDIKNRDEEMNRQIRNARNSLTNAAVMRDTGSMLAFLDADPSVKAGPKGCIGYCQSGRFIVTAAGSFPDQFAALASLYGIQIVTDEEDSPHLLADRIGDGELYLGFAEIDPLVPENVIPDLKAALDANGVAYTLEVHPGTRHGFCFPERPVYDEKAAEVVWGKVFDLYRRRLG
ncbi:MAG: dienelactone hydrolase family protein [bacterium]